MRTGQAGYVWAFRATIWMMCNVNSDYFLYGDICTCLKEFCFAPRCVSRFYTPMWRRTSRAKFLPINSLNGCTVKAKELRNCHWLLIWRCQVQTNLLAVTVPVQSLALSVLDTAEQSKTLKNLGCWDWAELIQGIDVDVDVVNNISDALPCWWQEGVFGCVWICFHSIIGL